MELDKVIEGLNRFTHKDCKDEPECSDCLNQLLKNAIMYLEDLESLKSNGISLTRSL